MSIALIACILSAVWLVLACCIIYFSVKVGYELCKHRLEDDFMALERMKERIREKSK